MLFGSWYRGDTNENGNQVTEFARMEPDGSYEFTFTEYDPKGHVENEIIELGDWGLVGDIHFTITRGEFVDGETFSADMANEDNYQAYQVLQLNTKFLEYKHIITNEVYILRRVVDKIAHC